MQTLACLLQKIVQHCWLIQQLDINGTHSTSLWLAFLTSIQAKESSKMCFLSTEWHKFALPHLPEAYTNASIFQTHKVVPIVHALEGIYCNYI